MTQNKSRQMLSRPQSSPASRKNLISASSVTKRLYFTRKCVCGGSGLATLDVRPLSPVSSSPMILGPQGLV